MPRGVVNNPPGLPVRILGFPKESRWILAPEAAFFAIPDRVLRRNGRRGPPRGCPKNWTPPATSDASSRDNLVDPACAPDGEGEPKREVGGDDDPVGKGGFPCDHVVESRGPSLRRTGSQRTKVPAKARQGTRGIPSGGRAMTRRYPRCSQAQVKGRTGAFDRTPWIPFADESAAKGARVVPSPEKKGSGRRGRARRGESDGGA
jgi:hypothetical protein